MANLYEQIGQTIRQLRGSLSQEALAAKLGVAANTVSRWETGTYKPTPEDLIISRATFLSRSPYSFLSCKLRTIGFLLLHPLRAASTIRTLKKSSDSPSSARRAASWKPPNAKRRNPPTRESNSAKCVTGDACGTAFHVSALLISGIERRRIDRG